MNVVVTVMVMIGVLLWNSLRLLLFVVFLPLILPRMAFLWLLHHNHLKVVARIVDNAQRIGIVYDQYCLRCTGDAWETARDVASAELIPAVDAKTTAEVLWTRCPEHGHLREPLDSYDGLVACSGCMDATLGVTSQQSHKPELPAQFRH